MESHKPRSGTASLATKLLLQSKFGMRLLLLFAACAFVPTVLLGLMVFHSAASQLTQQSWERLASASGAAGRLVFERLELLETDLRRVAPRLGRCADCPASLYYAADAVGQLTQRGELTWLGGDPDLDPPIGLDDLPPIGPGQSAVVARATAAGPVQLYLAHRPETVSSYFILRINAGYLWSAADEDALPSSLSLALWDPGVGTLIAPPQDIEALRPEASVPISRLPSGTFEGRGGQGDFLAAWWSLGAGTRDFTVPWKVILTEPKTAVLAPMASFRRDFPLLLAGALLAVLLISARQIRRSLQPLQELQRGTRRIAERDFEHQVHVKSGDELEELAGAFNTMSTRLARQFNALKAAAEIDRSVLSSVDAGAIAEAVVSRVPDVCPCDALSVTLLTARDALEGNSWRSGHGPSARKPAAARLGPEDLQLTRQHPERIGFGADAVLPAYLAHLRAGGATGPVEAFPLRYGGELLGVMAVRPKPGLTSEDDLLQIRRIADQVAVALSNARMVDQVRFLAFYDSLTKLPNRVLYKERLAQALVRAGRNNHFVAVCFVDLDNFSRINDTLGHDLGDELLKEVAARLVASSRASDSVSRVTIDQGNAEVSRLGGDEFTVVLSDLADPQESVRVTRRLLESLRRPMMLGNQEVFVSASIGVAIYPFDGGDTEELLKSADVAMYHAKEQGRNTYQMYSASMNAEAMARLQLEHQLRKAVEAGEFTIWYQPIVDLESRQPVGAEALVRWSHPERGLVSPGDFISLCEECGLIVPLGEWILRGVCSQAKLWDAAGFSNIRVSVNLSARQLRQEGIVDTVRTILQETGFRPRSLVLELTESMLMEPKGIMGRTLRELADLGISLAIDDFGTGYSSLSYLKNFPVTTLKIDRSFIAGTTTDPDDAAITTAIIALADAMELDVVAEGVETEAQADFLKERGCHKIQGYLVGKPMPREEFEERLREGRARAGEGRGRTGKTRTTPVSPRLPRSPQ